MNCRNCNHELTEETNFCPSCGARVVRQRITLKQLMGDVARQAFGWDNAYFRTLGNLVVRPEKVLTAYISGTRKKYLSPIAFFAIGTAICLVVFNLFADEYIDINQQLFVQPTIAEADSVATPAVPLDQPVDSTIAGDKNVKFRWDPNQETGHAIQMATLRYFNILSFLFLPIYTLISLMVYHKRYNFGEHLVINAYLQGALFASMLVLFVLGIFTSGWVYQLNFPLTVVYYLYAYSRLYQHSFGKAMLMLLKYLGVMLAFIIVSAVLIGIGSIVFAMLFS